MSIFYYKLWKKMADTNTSQQDLIGKCNISTYTITRLKRCESVGFDVLERICDYLNCDYGDIVSRFNNQKENDSDFKTNKSLSKDKLRETLIDYMKTNNLKYSDVFTKTFVSINTIKSFLQGNNISTSSAMKLLNLSNEFRDLFVAKVNNQQIDESDYSVKKIETYQKQECLKCPYLQKDILCDIVPSVKYDKNGVVVKYDNYYKSYYCNKGHSLSLDENYEPRPTLKCENTLDMQEKIDCNNENRVEIKAKPHYIVHEKEYIDLLNTIPKGYVTREDDIIEYFKRKYNVARVEIKWDMPAINKDIEKIPYWRIISQRGMLQNTLYYSKELQGKKLTEEGLEIAVSKFDSRSIMVVNYKDHLFKFV